MNAIGAARISGHGVATTSTATARRGLPLIAHADPATHERHGQEDGGIAIGHPDERRLALLRVAHQPHERRIRAARCRRRGLELEGLAGVRAAALRCRAGVQRARQRLACQRRVVDDGLGAQDDAVGWDHLAGPDEQAVSHLHLLDSNSLDGIAVDPVRPLRRPVDEERQLPAGAPLGIELERVPAGEHQRDHGPRQVLAERQRAGHGEKRDRIDADVTVKQRPADRDRKRDQEGEC